MAHTGRLLPHFFNNSLTCNAAPMVVVTDSLLQPGLLFLRECIAQSLSRGEHVVVIACEQSPSRLVPRGSDSRQVDIIDCVSAPPFASTSTSTAQQNQANLAAPDGVAILERVVIDSISQAVAAGKPVFVVLDSVTLLAERGAHVVVTLVRKVLRKLTQARSGSRFLTLHHDHFPPASSSGISSSSLLASLLSPSLSTSTIHLTLHPASLIELLSRDYGLNIPLQPTQSDPLDLRLVDFLQSFTSRLWADPFVRPTRSGDEDERLPLDIGGREEGSGVCVVEWATRGVNNVPALPPGSNGNIASARKADAGPKRLMQRGLEGLRRRRAGGVEAVGLSEVLDKKKMAVVNVQDSQTRGGTPSAKNVDAAPLPFNLSLTEAQHAAREDVALPFTRQEDRAEYRGGAINYDPDVGDDMDDDDPDEDLEA